MKNKITVLLVLFLFANLHAQIPKLKDINNLKSSKVIIGLTGNQNLNTALKELITAHWNISEIEGAAPLKEALGKAQKNPELYLLPVGLLNMARPMPKLNIDIFLMENLLVFLTEIKNQY